MNTNFSIKGKKIFRTRDERMIAGVAGGVAKFLGVDPVLVRLGFVAVAIASFGVAVAAYAVAWVVVPEESPAVSVVDDPFADSVDDPQHTGSSLAS